MTSKEKLVSAIDSGYISEELCSVLYALSQPHLSKGDLMKIVYGERDGKVDSSYPQEYADKMRELNPNFRGHFMVYDYNEPHRWGLFENVAERTIMKIQELTNQ